MLDLVLWSLESLIPEPRPNLLVVRAVDAQGMPATRARVNFLAEGYPRGHAVNTYDGTAAFEALYTRHGQELVFVEHLVLDMVVAGPDWKAARAAWVSEGRRNGKIDVVLEPIDLGVFAAEAREDASLDRIIGWTNRAMDEARAELSGDAFVDRAWELHGIRAVAANRVWAWHQVRFGEGVIGAQRRAERLARDWAEYADAAGRPSELAIDLCRAAAVRMDAC